MMKRLLLQAVIQHKASCNKTELNRNSKTVISIIIIIIIIIIIMLAVAACAKVKLTLYQNATVCYRSL